MFNKQKTITEHYGKWFQVNVCELCDCISPINTTVQNRACPNCGDAILTVKLGRVIRRKIPVFFGMFQKQITAHFEIKEIPSLTHKQTS